jgi:hypothetical protein
LKALLTIFTCVVALAFLLDTPGRAEVYKYVDKKGTVHYTDDPDQLPEPQRSKVLRELEEQIKKEQERRRKLKEQGIEVPDERLPPPPPPPPPHRPHPATNRLEQRKAARKVWEQRGQKARERVAELEEKCAELKEERDRNKTDSLTFARPGAGKRYQKSQAAYENCQKDLKKARNYLNEGLPEQARRAGVPPGWIR